MISAALFLTFAVITVLGMPIALALVGGGMAAVAVGDIMPLYTVVQKMFSSIDSFTLAAIPFFMLAGALMSSGGISKRLIDFANAAVGWLPGGLGVVSIFACMLFGCLCGSPTATVAAIGSIMIPALEMGGYDRKFALSTVAAAGMLGTIIPPSTVMITYCSATGVSVGNMFMAGIVPGIILGILMIVIAVVYGVKNKIPRTKFSLRQLGVASYHAIGAIFMPIIILGGIYTGVFTPTESAAVACAYGLVVGCFIYREIDRKALVQTVRTAAASSGMIMFIVACAGVFGLLMTREQIPAHAAEYLMRICSNKYVFLLLVNALLLVVGCFMDTTPAVLIIAPILLPAVVSYGIDTVHFGIVMLLNMCIGMITPPLGINLYVAATLRQAKVGDLVNRHLLKYMACCLVNLLLITYIPEICLWIPSLMK
ncbi:MAG: TRAP transporter large permease [Oscillospiraceae bacterium]|nr:TRAP transporter large permease [Oscillospiraceae bacterium]